MTATGQATASDFEYCCEQGYNTVTNTHEAEAKLERAPAQTSAKMMVDLAVCSGLRSNTATFELREGTL